MSQRDPKTNDPEAITSPTAWFAVLERARLVEDYELAAKAKRELERLGVKVKWGRPRKEAPA